MCHHPLAVREWGATAQCAKWLSCAYLWVFLFDLWSWTEIQLRRVNAGACKEPTSVPTSYLVWNLSGITQYIRNTYTFGNLFWPVLNGQISRRLLSVCNAKMPSHEVSEKSLVRLIFLQHLKRWILTGLWCVYVAQQTNQMRCHFRSTKFGTNLSRYRIYESGIK